MLNLKNFQCSSQKKPLSCRLPSAFWRFSSISDDDPMPFFIRIVKKNFFTQKHHTIRFRKLYISYISPSWTIVISAIIIILALGASDYYRKLSWTNRKESQALNMPARESMYKEKKLTSWWCCGGFGAMTMWI